MVQAKMNLHLNLPVSSLTCISNIKDEKIIDNNHCVLHTHMSTRKSPHQKFFIYQYKMQAFY